MFRSITLLCAVVCLPALADEGMWLFNNFPTAKVKEKYGVELSKDWLDHLRLSSLRIANGCSASAVAPGGLVLTNHHCARSCISNLAGLQKKDFLRDGFFAKTQALEARCPGVELNQLLEMTDVTARVQAATKGAADADFDKLQKAEISAIEKECSTGAGVRCDVVSLYRGGRYELYRYRRLQDVRLVFAPEGDIAHFGGDPDNFNFPRYSLDFSFLRVYGDDGKPLTFEHHLTWGDGSLKAGDAVFVSGHPGGTNRSLTVAQLEYMRDVAIPQRVARYSELRGLLTEYANRSAEHHRHSSSTLMGVENGLKVFKGRFSALTDKAFFSTLVKREQDFRAAVNANADLKKQYGGAWAAMEELVKKQRALMTEYAALEHGAANSTLFSIASSLLRYGAESAKPNEERLPEYSDARLPQLKQRLLSNAPIYDDLEVLLLTQRLARLFEDLGPDHPAIRRAFAGKSPAELAKAAVKGTKLKELKVDKAGNATGGLRKTLFDGGKAAIDASKDPMIELARLFDAEAREVRARYEKEIEGPMKKQQELIAKARFAVYGAQLSPDATFTLRLSYGAVKGWKEGGRDIEPFTRVGGVFERHTGADPFALPKSWLAAKSKLNAEVPFDLVTTNDIIGGNSGSPLVNAKGELVGLVFDGNIHSLGGDFGYDDTRNRAVSVHSAVILESLEKVYGAARLVEELKQK